MSISSDLQGSRVKARALQGNSRLINTLNQCYVTVVKKLPVSAGDTRMQVQALGWEDPLEEEMATHFSILAWKIPWTEEPCGLQSMGSQRVGHN